MTKNYKKYVCLNEECGNVWLGSQIRPRCPKCKKYIIQVLEPKNKIIVEDEVEDEIKETNEFEEFEEIEEVNQVIYTPLDYELEEEVEKQKKDIKFNCGDCGYNKIEFGSLYCENCGEALEVDWKNINF